MPNQCSPETAINGLRAIDALTKLRAMIEAAQFLHDGDEEEALRNGLIDACQDLIIRTLEGKL